MCGRPLAAIFAQKSQNFNQLLPQKKSKISLKRWRAEPTIVSLLPFPRKKLGFNLNIINEKVKIAGYFCWNKKDRYIRFHINKNGVQLQGTSFFMPTTILWLAAECTFFQLMGNQTGIFNKRKGILSHVLLQERFRFLRPLDKGVLLVRNLLW